MEALRGLFVSFSQSEEFEENFQAALERITEKECCKVLEKIIEIIRNDELDDKDCFLKIEEIICYFESLGIDCGSRHDF